MTEKHEIQNLLDFGLNVLDFPRLDLFDFGFVSDFDIWISNLFRWLLGPVKI